MLFRSVYAENNVVNAADVPIRYGFKAVANLIQEIDLSNLVRSSNGFADRDLESGDYLGIDIQSNADNGDTLNAFVLGIKLRYKIF